MNGPILKIKQTENRGDAFVPTEDITRINDGHHCTRVVVGANTFCTNTPAAEIVAEIDRLKAEQEHQHDPETMRIGRACVKRLSARLEQYREALEKIATHQDRREFLVRYAQEALKPPKPDSHAKAADIVDGWMDKDAPSSVDDPTALLTRLREKVSRHLDEIKKPREPTPSVLGSPATFATTWQEEHYPVEAEQLKNASDEACTVHGLKKWKGARAKNLERYGMRYAERDIKGLDYSLRFSGESCALCQKYGRGRGGLGCPHCPIVKAGLPACDKPTSAWQASRNDPEPMIAALEAALARIQAAKKPEPSQLERVREEVEGRRKTCLIADSPWWKSRRDAYKLILCDIDKIQKADAGVKA